MGNQQPTKARDALVELVVEDQYNIGPKEIRVINGTVFAGEEVVFHWERRPGGQSFADLEASNGSPIDPDEL